MYNAIKRYISDSYCHVDLSDYDPVLLFSDNCAVHIFCLLEWIG